MGKILVVRKHLNQGVGDQERSPLGRRQDQVVTSTWVSHPGQNPDQSPGGEAYIPWSLGTKGNKEVEGGSSWVEHRSSETGVPLPGVDISKGKPELQSFHHKLFRCIINLIHCNQLFQLNS